MNGQAVERQQEQDSRDRTRPHHILPCLTRAVKRVFPGRSRMPTNAFSHEPWVGKFFQTYLPPPPIPGDTGWIVNSGLWSPHSGCWTSFLALKTELFLLSSKWQYSFKLILSCCSHSQYSDSSEIMCIISLPNLKGGVGSFLVQLLTAQQAQQL